MAVLESEPQGKTMPPGETIQDVLLFEVRELRADIKSLQLDVIGLKDKMKFRMAVLGVFGGSLASLAGYIAKHFV